MTIRKSLLLLLTLSMIAALVACSSSSKAPTTVTLSSVPAILLVNATQSITATTNDAAGVTWSCTPASTCGTFSAATSLTGVAVTYTAPATVPASTVVITATSVTDTSVSASTAAITISAIPTVTLSTFTTSLYVNDTAPITATTTDPAGVTWSCAPAGTCGTFSSATSLTGVAVTYTAPATVPASTVVITATSVTDTAISASTAAITINATVIAVSLSTPPPSTLSTGATADVAATVASDPNSAGVTWSCTPVGSCGSFSAPTGAYPTFGITYTAPATVPTGNTVTIIATSISDDAVNATSSPVTITGVTGITLTAGTYVYSFSGTDANDSFYSVSGAFSYDGNGNITNGEQDFVDWYYEVEETGLTGNIVASTDGTGNLVVTINTGDTCIGPGANDTGTDGCAGTGTGVETLVATPVTSSKLTVAEYDSWAASSGSLDLQNSQIGSPANGYAFYVGGVDVNFNPVAIGGIINVDGSGTISGSGSVFDANDQGNTFVDETLASNESTVTGPDGFGRVTFTLFPTDTADFGDTIALAGYMVDGNHIRLVETGDNYGGSTGGTAFGQGSNTGNFSSISGNSYVAGLIGDDPNGVFQATGLLNESSGAFSGYVNFNDLTGPAIQVPDAVSEETTYTLDSTGRVSIPGMTDGTITFNLQVYLDGNGHGVAISLDNNDVLAGLVYQQTGGGSFTASSFSGTYAMNAGGADVNDESELNTVGPVIADGVGTLTGSADLTWAANGGPVGDVTITDGFTVGATGAAGIFTGTITGLDVTTPSNQDNFAYYLIDTSKVLMIETDPNQLTLGYFLLQQ
ncbi:MAG: hypothetical protein WCF68_15445 [Terriglobales bacterium]